MEAGVTQEPLRTPGQEVHTEGGWAQGVATLRRGSHSQKSPASLEEGWEGKGPSVGVSAGSADGTPQG